MIYSERSGNHIVSLCDDGTYACDCIGWRNHYPRINCKHIKEVWNTNPTPLNQDNWDALNGNKKKLKDTLAIFNKVIQNQEQRRINNKK
jgi:hypothetical protein